MGLSPKWLVDFTVGGDKNQYFWGKKVIFLSTTIKWYYFLMCSIVFHIKNEFAFCLIVLDGTSKTCLLIYLWFSWKKNKANMCHLLSWGYLPSSFIKHKTTFHYMTTLNGPEQSSKTSPWDKFLMCGNWSQNILTFFYASTVFNCLQLSCSSWV